MSSTTPCCLNDTLFKRRQKNLVWPHRLDFFIAATAWVRPRRHNELFPSLLFATFVDGDSEGKFPFPFVRKFKFEIQIVTAHTTRLNHCVFVLCNLRTFNYSTNFHSHLNGWKSRNIRIINGNDFHLIHHMLLVDPFLPLDSCSRLSSSHTCHSSRWSSSIRLEIWRWNKMLCVWRQTKTL